MDKLKELQAALASCDAKIDALVDLPEMSAEQVAEHDVLVSDRAKLAADIAKEKKRLSLLADKDNRKAERESLAKEAAELANKPAPRQTAPNVPVPFTAEVTGTANFPRAVIPANVKTCSLRNFRGARNGYDADERAYRFGMWVLARLSQDMPGRYRFSNALDYFEQNKWAVAHQSNNATGTFNLIPDEFGTDLVDLRERYGVCRRIFKMVPMASDTRTDPRRAGGLTAYFVTEGLAGTESNKTWDNVRLTAKDLMVLARYTNQVNADAVINIGDDLAGEIAYSFANKEDECGINGDGTSTYGHIVGARTALNTAAGAPTTTSAGGVIIAAGNAYSEITLANFSDVVGVLPQYADTPNTAWVVHKTFYHGVMQKLELAAGGVTANEISVGDRRPRPLFMGYPVEFSQVMPATAANSQVCALLGDFTLGARFGDRQQDSIAFSEHASVGSENVFERNQIAIRGTERFDINVHDVGSTTAAGPIVGLQTLNS